MHDTVQEFPLNGEDSDTTPPERKGPFQCTVRNLGLKVDFTLLPRHWPYGLTAIANALYEAGYPSGEDLLKQAKILYQYQKSEN